MWTDEVKAVCPGCKKAVLRTDGQSCLDWCKFAKQCVGEQLYGKYMRNKTITLKEKLLVKLQEHFGSDAGRIEHAKRVMGFAEELLRQEKGDWHIVIPASILHDAGIKESERKHGSSDAQYQEKEGALIARKYLLELGFKKEDIEEICQIIAHHHTPGVVTTTNFKVLYDADSLVNLREKVEGKGKDAARELIERTFLTKTGKEAAKREYLT